MLGTVGKRTLLKFLIAFKTTPKQHFSTTETMNTKISKNFKVLITNPEVPSKAIEMLKKTCQLTLCQKLPPERNEMLEKCKGMDAIFWATYDKLNDEVLNAAGDQLKVISTMSSGIDYVDIEALKKRKILLGHTPGAVSNSVAEVAIGLMVATARRFHEGRLHIENESWITWSHRWMLGHEIKGSTVGIVGFGGIGQTIAKRLQGYEIGRLIYSGHRQKPQAKELKAEYVSFDELLTTSDFIIAACPITSETKEMFNEAAFDKMKPTSIFVNVARGQIVDQTALYNALKTHKIFAAGLDVMTPEPLPKHNSLLTLPNCVIIPHLGTATDITTENMAVIAAHNILRGLEGQPMLSPAFQL